MTSAFHRLLPACCTLILLVALLAPATGMAQAQAESQFLSLAIIIDGSGSMAGENGADIAERRWTAAKLLISLLQPGDEVSVLVFSSTTDDRPAVRRLREASPLIRIGTLDEKAALLRELEQFRQANPPKGATDMLAAFNDVAPLIRQARSDSRAAIIFLTDGEPYVPEWKSPQGGTFEQEYIPALRQQVSSLNVPLYAGGLWAGADCNNLSGEQVRGNRLLNQLAQATPGGQARCISQAAQVPSFFLSSFGALTGRLYVRPGSDGRFEVTDEQGDLLQQATMIYLDDERRCDVATTKQLCAPLTDRTGAALTPDSLRARSDVDLLSDPDFLFVNFRVPEPGTWLLGNNPANWHVVLRTNLRMELGVPEPLVGRQPLGQPLDVRVRFLQQQDDGSEMEVHPRTSPVWQEQSITLLGDEGPGTPAGFDSPLGAVSSPSDAVFLGRAPAQNQAGLYRVRVRGEIGGFTFEREQQLSIEPFPQFEVAGLRADTPVIHPRSEPLTVRLEPRLNGQIEPLTGLTPQHVVLSCANQPITPTLQETGGVYLLGFLPPQQEVNTCELILSGVLTYRGIPFRLNQPPVTFTVELKPLLRLEAPTSTIVFGPTLARTLEITGTTATLLGDRGTKLFGEVLDSDAFTVNIRPQSIQPGQPISVTIELMPKTGTGFQSYSGRIAIKAEDGVIVNGTQERRFELDLVPESITVNTNAIRIAQPMHGVGDPAGVVSINVTSALVTPRTLNVQLVDATGAALQGVAMRLDRADLPTTGTHTYKLQLQSAGGDLAQPDWRTAQPFTYTVLLDAGPGVQVLPAGAAILVTGARASLIDTFRARYAQPIAWTLGGLVMLSSVLTLGWVFTLFGWMRANSGSFAQPNGYLIPVTIDSGRTQSNTHEQSITLAGFGAGLKRRLFGIRMRQAGASLPPRQRPWWRPEQFWARILRAQTVDYALSTRQELDFRLRPQPGSDLCTYQVINLATSPLQIARGAASEQTRRSGASRPTQPTLIDQLSQGGSTTLNYGDVIIIAPDQEVPQGLILAREAELVPPGSPNPRRTTGQAAPPGSTQRDDAAQVDTTAGVRAPRRSAPADEETGLIPAARDESGARGRAPRRSASEGGDGDATALPHRSEADTHLRAPRRSTTTGGESDAALPPVRRRRQEHD